MRPLCDHLPAPGPSSDCPLRSSPPTVASMIQGFRGSAEHMGLCVTTAPNPLKHARVFRASVAVEKALGEPIRDVVAARDR